MRGHELANVMRREAQRVLSLSATPRFGLVDSYNPADHTAKVLLSPSNAITGWLPVATSYMGNGWGMIAPLQAGDQVLVVFSQDDQDSGVVVGRIFDQGHQAPQGAAGPAQAGEIWFRHQSGSYIGLTANSRALLNGAVEIDMTGPTINITATAAVNITAPAVNIGSSGETLQAVLNAAAAAVFNGHTHPSNGAVPTQKMTAPDMTTALMAG